MMYTEPIYDTATAWPVMQLDIAQPYGFRAGAKDPAMLDTLNALTRWHLQRCAPYANMVERLFPAGSQAATRAEVPYLPVRLF